MVTTTEGDNITVHQEDDHLIDDSMGNVVVPGGSVTGGPVMEPRPLQA